MTSVCFYFQVHQPFRLRAYSVHDRQPPYFDDAENRRICERVADKCYRPATSLMLELVKQYAGAFRVSYSISGVALDQFALWTPDVIELFQELSATGACEFIAETSHHSLSFLSSRAEFDAQVEAHGRRMQELFGQQPRVFRNTELTYANDVAEHIASLGRYDAVICEGLDRVLGYRSPNYVYVPPGRDDVRLLLKNYRLSDDIAFRFSNRGWEGWPLLAETFASWVDAINGDGHLCNLFMDYETIGEHQWAETGIFDFFRALPEKLLNVRPGHNGFVTVSEALRIADPVGEYDVPEMSSWADTERDLSAWLSNPMQHEACRVLYELEAPIKALGDPDLLEDWRRLTTSDHLYYMCTKFWADGDVHKYFSPYESPYEAYVTFMNVLDDVRRRAGVRDVPGRLPQSV